MINKTQLHMQSSYNYKDSNSSTTQLLLKSFLFFSKIVNKMTGKGESTTIFIAKKIYEDECRVVLHNLLVKTLNKNKTNQSSEESSLLIQSKRPDHLNQVKTKIKDLTEKKVTIIVGKIINKLNNAQKKEIVHQFLLEEKGYNRINFDMQKKEDVVDNEFFLEKAIQKNTLGSREFCRKIFVYHDQLGNTGVIKNEYLQKILDTIKNKIGDSKVVLEVIADEFNLPVQQKNEKSDDYNEKVFSARKSEGVYKNLFQRLLKIDKNKDGQYFFMVRSSPYDPHMTPVNVRVKNGKVLVIVTDSTGDNPHYLDKKKLESLIKDNNKESGFTDFDFILSTQSRQTSSTGCSIFAIRDALSFIKDPDLFNEIQSRALYEEKEMSTLITEEKNEGISVKTCELLPSKLMEGTQSMTAINEYIQNEKKFQEIEENEKVLQYKKECLDDMKTKIEDHSFTMTINLDKEKGDNVVKKTNQLMHHCRTKYLAYLFVY
jgi:hypothetical protein